MSIKYTYEIIRVDKEARNMEIVYSAEGHQTMHIGARLPYEGESLEAIVEMYSPVNYWFEQAATVVEPLVGTKGTISPMVELVVDSVPLDYSDQPEIIITPTQL